MNGYMKNMSIVFVPEKLRGRAQINQEIIQRLLEENDQLVRIIVEYQRKGRAAECVRLQLKTWAFVQQHKYKVKRARVLVHQQGKKTQTHGETPAENMGICAAAQVQSEESKSLSPPPGKENTDTWGDTNRFCTETLCTWQPLQIQAQTYFRPHLLLQLKTWAFVQQHKYKVKRARVLVHHQGKKTQTHGEGHSEQYTK
ncbi:UNVERIFIED_CONTAM: hypothetical protein FKN15_070730 [Acipenser sinensis]